MEVEKAMLETVLGEARKHPFLKGISEIIKELADSGKGGQAVWKEQKEKGKSTEEEGGDEENDRNASDEEEEVKVRNFRGDVKVSVVSYFYSAVCCPATDYRHGFNRPRTSTYRNANAQFDNHSLSLSLSRISLPTLRNVELSMPTLKPSQRLLQSKQRPR